MTDPSYSANANVELPEAPRFLFIRARLESTQLQDKELRRLAISSDPADNQQAVAILQLEATAAPEKEITPSCWGHLNASFWLLRAQADSRAFIYAQEELYIATAFCAAELQVSRALPLPEIELHVFGLVESANKLITGWRKGRQPGLARFLASAAKHNGASFSLYGAPHRA